MLLLRIVALLTAITIGSSVAAWLLTGNRSYLAFAFRVAKVALALCLFVLVLMFGERLLTL